MANINLRGNHHTDLVRYIGVSHPIRARKDPAGAESHIGSQEGSIRSHTGANHHEDNECTEPRIRRRMDDHAAAPVGETTTTPAVVRHIFSVYSAEILDMLRKIATSAVY